MSSRVLVRVLLSVLAGALCGVAVACGAVLLGDRDQVTVAGPPALAPAREQAPPVTRDRAREVLRRWDTARARAWTAGDARALRSLYTPRSVAGARDVAMLRAWTARGARVTELTTQVLGLQVLVERERRLVLVVTDRVDRLQVDGVGSATLPRDRASTRRLELVRSAGAWQVASVASVAPGISRGPPARS